MAVLTSPEGQRRVAVEHVATGPKRSVLANDEFIESIEMPIVDGWQGYSKIGTRNAMVISVAGVAVVLSASSNSCRIALGSVGPLSCWLKTLRFWQEIPSIGPAWRFLRIRSNALGNLCSRQHRQSTIIGRLLPTEAIRSECWRDDSSNEGFKK